MSAKPNCKCRENEFQCKKTLQCIPLRSKCDFVKDCEDLSDEEDCKFKECVAKEEFTCWNNGKKIHVVPLRFFWICGIVIFHKKMLTYS